MTEPTDAGDAAVPVVGRAEVTPAQPPARRPRPGPGLPDAVRQAAAVPVTVATAPVKAVTHSGLHGGQLARRPRPGPLAAAPNLARVAAESAWALAAWSIGATVAGANFVAKRALDGDSPSTIMSDAAQEFRRAAWRALGVSDQAAAEVVGDLPAGALRPAPTGAQTPADLQRRGTELLRRSNDVHLVEDIHPAFSRILTEITPDEARILRYLYLDGPQPSVDVRTFRPLNIGSMLVAGGINMIAEHAGCRHPGRANPYLTNLSRLGLVDFPKEPVSNPYRYQVLEAQPKALDATKRAGRFARTIHRSIRLTEFGEEFVRTCLPLNGRVVPYRDRVLPGRPGRRNR